MKKNIYITTPIYYVNDHPHIGHAYTTILGDTLKRYYQLLGHDTFFLTGTDEHGQKVQQAANKKNISPEKQVNECHKRFKELWEKLNISYDRFIRTTESQHCTYVQKKLQELYAKEEIYSKKYAGWYSIGEERFFSDDELVNGKDPINGHSVEWTEEKNYFFTMGKYQEALIEHIQSNSDFIAPEHRRNEVLGFLKKPLQDLCISRPKSRLTWGITLPFDSDFVTYVWFDALLNYQSALCGEYIENEKSKKKNWPANFHLIGKDILITHSVYWPTMLLALNEELPKHIMAHGWWLTDGKKLSKSSGNVIDPISYIDKHGADSVRFFLMRNMKMGQDATFTDQFFIQRVNTDLANDLGNAVNRVHKLLCKNFSGSIPVPGKAGKEEEDLRQLVQSTVKYLPNALSQVQISQMIEKIFDLVVETNCYLERKAPWHLVKNREELQDRSNLSTILYHAAETLRLALVLLVPVMPRKAIDGLAMLGIVKKISGKDLFWGILQGGEKIVEKEALFPRIS